MRSRSPKMSVSRTQAKSSCSGQTQPKSNFFSFCKRKVMKVPSEELFSLHRSCRSYGPSRHETTSHKRKNLDCSVTKRSESKDYPWRNLGKQLMSSSEQINDSTDSSKRSNASHRRSILKKPQRCSDARGSSRTMSRDSILSPRAGSKRFRSGIFRRRRSSQVPYNTWNNNVEATQEEDIQDYVDTLEEIECGDIGANDFAPCSTETCATLIDGNGMGDDSDERSETRNDMAEDDDKCGNRKEHESNRRRSKHNDVLADDSVKMFRAKSCEKGNKEDTGRRHMRKKPKHYSLKTDCKMWPIKSVTAAVQTDSDLDQSCGTPGTKRSVSKYIIHFNPVKADHCRATKSARNRPKTKCKIILVKSIPCDRTSPKISVKSLTMCAVSPKRLRVKVQLTRSKSRLCPRKDPCEKVSSVSTRKYVTTREKKVQRFLLSSSESLPFSNKNQKKDVYLARFEKEWQQELNLRREAQKCHSMY